MLVNNYALRKYKAVEENIYGLIKMKKKINLNPVLIYDDYRMLFLMFLEFDPTKVHYVIYRLLSSARRCYPINSSNI